MPLRVQHRLLFAAALSAAALLSACNPFGTPFMTNDEDEPRIPVNNNPQPKRAYRLTMVLADAPGPFNDISGGVQYDVENAYECSQRNPATNTFSRITHIPDLDWRQTAPNTYETTVYADLLQNEDYFGRGLCRWKLIAASASLRATGDEKQTRFQPALDDDEIYGEATKTLYFLNRDYPSVETIANYAEFGEEDPSQYKPELRDQLFTITLTARKAQP